MKKITKQQAQFLTSLGIPKAQVLSKKNKKNQKRLINIYGVVKSCAVPAQRALSGALLDLLRSSRLALSPEPVVPWAISEDHETQGLVGTRRDS